MNIKLYCPNCHHELVEYCGAIEILVPLGGRINLECVVCERLFKVDFKYTTRWIKDETYISRG